MSETDQTSKVDHPTKPHRHQWWTRFIGYGERKVEDRRAKIQQEPPTDKATRATVWMAFFTLIIVLANIGTLWVLNKQLKEMHDSGTDTHNLANAADNQATWTQRLATSAGIQADRTKDLADRMKDQADRTKSIAEQAVVQAQAAKSAALTAKNALILDQRPWVGIAQTPSGIEHPDVSTRVKFRFENSGKSPATNVIFSGAVWADSTHPSIKVTSYSRTLGNCHGDPNATGNSKAGLLLPAQFVEEEAIGLVEPNELARVEKAGGQAWLVATGCIDYDDMIGGPHHQLLFCFYYIPEVKSFAPCEEGYRTRDGEYWKQKQ